MRLTNRHKSELYAGHAILCELDESTLSTDIAADTPQDGWLVCERN